MTKLTWKPHYVVSDMRHAHHNGYSILWAKTPNAKQHLGGSTYEIMPGVDGDDISRFNKRSEMIQAIQ
jgi:hypothetical protein